MSNAYEEMLKRHNSLRVLAGQLFRDHDDGPVFDPDDCKVIDGDDNGDWVQVWMKIKIT